MATRIYAGIDFTRKGVPEQTQHGRVGISSESVPGFPPSVITQTLL